MQASDFPLILSLENHCGLEQQKVMAQHLELILGNMLLRAPLGGQVSQKLPSPQASGPVVQEGFNHVI